MRKIYYFDNNATTPVAPEVVAAMTPYLSELWANPSSGYQFANRVAKDVESARAKVAALINADPREVVFTSCGTESINTVLHSAATISPQKRHIVTTSVEHSATLRCVEYLATQGYEVTLLPVNSEGALDLMELERSIRPDTAMVSIMWANNETGVIFPIPAVAEICRKKQVLFHSDAVQAAGKEQLDVRAVGLDCLSLSAHKLYAPKGIGMVYLNRGSRFRPLIRGGQQEGGRRGGTENVPGIIAFGAAAELAMNRLREENERVRALRDRLETALLKDIPGTARNGAAELRLANTSNLAFDSVEAEAVLIKLDQLGICASSGSACRTGSLEPSHVLKAMGFSASRARSSVRLSLGFYNTAEDVDYLAAELPGIIRKLRAL